MKGWNRVDDLCCVTCGSPLVDPKNSPLSMCTQCFKDAREASKKQIGNIKNRKGVVKRFTVKMDPRVIHSKFKIKG